MYGKPSVLMNGSTAVMKRLICKTHSSGEPVVWNGKISVTLWDLWVHHLVRLLRFSCSNKVKDFLDIYSWLLVCCLGLLSWSRKCWLRGGCWKCYVCKLHWWHGYHVLSLYFPNICWILQCKIGIDLRVLVPLKITCTLLSKDSSKYLTEANNIGNRDEDIFLYL